MTAYPPRLEFKVALLLIASVAVARGPGGNALRQDPWTRPLRTVYVAPDGQASNSGSVDRPLDLATALSQKGPVRPGDLIWLRQGTYRGAFVSELAGTPDAPITVEQYPGERATIDSAPAREPALTVRGSWTTYRGFEVMNSDPRRVSAEPGSVDIRRGLGLDVHADHSRLINLVVHDTAVGMGIWSDAVDTEAYGNIIYYNGWDAADRSHGHGIYTQNRTGHRLLAENVIFSQFSHGIHAYGSDQANLDSITLRGNVSFNNGALRRGNFDRNILLGGGGRAQDPVLESNFTFYSEGIGAGGENNVGYAGGCANLIARQNYLMGHSSGGSPLTLSKCEGEVSDNTLYGSFDDGMVDAYPQNTYTRERPTGLTVFVRPNEHERGRAHVIVYNWDRLREVTLDLTGAGLESGEEFRMLDAQDYFGPPVFRGIYTGEPVTIGMRGLVAAPAVGEAVAPPHTAPDFAVFIVVPDTSERPKR